MIAVLKKASLATFFALIMVSEMAHAAELHKGGTAADIAAIKVAVAASRPEGTITDWFIAVDGSNAVAAWAMGPAAGGNTGVVKRQGKWTVTCQDTSKGHLGPCNMPPATFKRLETEANGLMSHQ